MEQAPNPKQDSETKTIALHFPIAPPIRLSEHLLASIQCVGLKFKLRINEVVVHNNDNIGAFARRIGAQFFGVRVLTNFRDAKRIRSVC